MKQETVLAVLKTYEIHFPLFFKDKNDNDKVRMVADWLEIYKDIDDEVFVKACSELVKETDYFPSTKAIFDKIKRVELSRQFETTQKKFHLEECIKNACLTDETIDKLIELEEVFFSETPDKIDRSLWEGKRKNARPLLKTELGLTDEQIDYYGREFEKASENHQSDFYRDLVYDELVLNKKAIRG